MAQFQVPQFIETESKIVGPLTLKQFLFVAAAALLSFFLFFLLKTFVWIILTGIVGVIAISLAFIKYNGRPLTVVLKSALSYIWKPRLYLWKKADETAKMPELPKMEKETPLSPLKNLWLKIHTGQPAKPAPPPKPILHGFHKEHQEKTGQQLLQKIQEQKKSGES